MDTQEVSESSVLHSKVEDQRTAFYGVGISLSIIPPIMHMSAMGE
jgi:hypothetical protein